MIDDGSLHSLWVKVVAAAGWIWDNDIAVWARDGVSLDHDRVPDYTEDMSWAWTLVDEMVAAEAWVMVSTDDRHKGSWVCDIQTGTVNIREYMEIADTAPVAICRAYLAWKAGEK